MTTKGPSAGSGMPEGQITKEALDQLYQLVGQELRTERFIREMSLEVMQRFAAGIGDVNPLYTDPAHAIWTRFGDVIGHPCLLYARHYPGRTRFGLPGVHGFFGGNDWRWYRPVHVGDRVACTERVTGVEEKRSQKSGILVLTKTVTTYLNQRDEVLAVAEGWSTRHERRALRASSSGEPEGAKRSATSEQLEQAYGLQIAETDNVAGATVKYWDDVQVGEELPMIARGPLSMLDISSYLIGVGRTRGAHGVALQKAAKHPQHFFRSNTGQIEYTGAGHADEGSAADVGTPGRYDYGPQRISWLASLVTNWMGDLGWLTRLRAELRGFNVVGDITFLHGRVTSKPRPGECELEVWGENQNGDITMPGIAEVELPIRGPLAFPQGYRDSWDLSTARSTLNGG